MNDERANLGDIVQLDNGREYQLLLHVFGKPNCNGCAGRYRDKICKALPQCYDIELPGKHLVWVDVSDVSF